MRNEVQVPKEIYNTISNTINVAKLYDEELSPSATGQIRFKHRRF